jgi:hypothetical protein
MSLCYKLFTYMRMAKNITPCFWIFLYVILPPFSFVYFYYVLSFCLVCTVLAIHCTVSLAVYCCRDSLYYFT